MKSSEELYEERVNEASKEYKFKYFNPISVPDIDLPPIMGVAAHFKAGVEFANSNPSPKVQALLAALEFYSDRDMFLRPGCEYAGSGEYTGRDGMGDRARATLNAYYRDEHFILTKVPDFKKEG